MKYENVSIQFGWEKKLLYLKLYRSYRFMSLAFTIALPSTNIQKQSKRKVQGVPQSQTAALPRHQEEEETDKSKQAQIEQTYEKH